MEEVNIILLELYNIEKFKEKEREEGKLPVLKGAQLALWQLNKEYNKVVDSLEELQEENKKFRNFILQQIKMFEETPLNEDGKHRIIVDSKFLKELKSILLTK